MQPTGEQMKQQIMNQSSDEKKTILGLQMGSELTSGLDYDIELDCDINFVLQPSFMGQKSTYVSTGKDHYSLLLLLLYIIYYIRGRESSEENRKIVIDAILSKNEHLYKLLYI